MQGRISVVIASSLVLITGLFLARRPWSEPPNIVLIVVDTLRADHLGFLGYERATSPHLDRLARDSVVFTRAYSSAPWTTPAVSSILTARHPSILGYSDSKEPAFLDEAFPVLPELLAANGYETHAVVAHTFVGSKLGFDRGFDSFDEDNARGPAHVSSERVTSAARQLIGSWLDRESAQRKPFFLLLHYFDPHFNYIQHEQFDFDPDYHEDLPDNMGEIRRMSTEMGAIQIAHLQARYDSEIRFTDQHVGSLIDFLKDNELYSDALVVVVADHGEAFHERGDPWIGHSRTLYEEAIRVPLMFKLPSNLNSGLNVAATVATLDITPSVLSLLHLSGHASKEFDGRAIPLSSEAELRALADRVVFSETRAHGRWLQAAISGRSKIVADRKGSRSYFYDLEADPREQTSLELSNAQTFLTLADELENWRLRIEEQRRVQIKTPEFSPEEIDRLEALGYL